MIYGSAYIAQKFIPLLNEKDFFFDQTKGFDNKLKELNLLLQSSFLF